MDVVERAAMVSTVLIHASANALPLRDESVQCVVTSPPYWGLRAYAGEQEQVWGGDSDHEHEWTATERVGGGRQHSEKRRWQHSGHGEHGHANVVTSFCECGAWFGALGIEPSPDLYVEHMVEVFREVRRVLRPDGTLWLNLGDSYAGGGRGGNPTEATSGLQGGQATHRASMVKRAMTVSRRRDDAPIPRSDYAIEGLPAKNLIGMPWRVAFALQADGWVLRSDIIWHKPNPMPESVTDRPTKAHEYLFLLSKSERYFYDADSIREPFVDPPERVRDRSKNFSNQSYPGGRSSPGGRSVLHLEGRNKRDVWTIPTRPYSGAHFATFPEALVEPCLKAGSRPGDLVLDPFNGSGTTGRVAVRLGRSYVGVDISREYLVEQATKRLNGVQMEAAL